MTAFWLNVIWMMASQLWWEKSQGNLELYFAAPMNIMAVLFGMAFGGMVMSSTRAVVVLVVAIGRLRRHVRGRPVVPAARGLLPDPGRAVRAGHGARQPVPDVGPRGVAPDPAPRRAGLLRLRAELPGRAASASSARWRIATIPLAVGLDAMRQLAFAGLGATRSARRRPEVEALILVAMTVVFLAAARWMLGTLERLARQRRPAVGALAVTAASSRDRRRTAGLGSPGVGRLRPRRGPRGRGPADGMAQLPDRGQPRLADGGELDRPGPVLHLLGREAGLARR